MKEGITEGKKERSEGQRKAKGRKEGRTYVEEAREEGRKVRAVRTVRKVRKEGRN